MGRGRETRLERRTHKRDVQRDMWGATTGATQM